MRRQNLVILLAVLIVGADDLPDEAGTLQGTWAVVCADGLDVPKEAVKGLKVSIRGETLRLFVAKRGNGKETVREVAKVTFKLDPSKKPKAIDMTRVDADGKGPTVRGIYELNGDTLKLHWSQTGPRPKEFPTQLQDPSRRPKPAKLPARQPASREAQCKGAPPAAGAAADRADHDHRTMVLKREEAP
jgi:uncharacterized protein (TIGR03067 family)